MIKKITSTILILLFLTSTIYGANTNTEYRMQPILEKLNTIKPNEVENTVSRFSDMNHWSREFVGKLTYLEIIGGYPDGTFKPDRNIQVDEFIKLVVTAMGYKPETGDDYWAAPYIEIAKKEGLITEGEFKDYKRFINRQEMAKIIANALLTKEVAPHENLMGYLRSTIRDYPNIPDPYKNHVLTAYSMGLITGYPDREFKPLNNATRAESSVVIMRFLDPNLREIKTLEGISTITLPFRDGKLYTVYSPPQEDVIKVAKALQNAIPKSKGAVSLMYSPFSKEIYAYGYNSAESMEEDFNTPSLPLGRELSIGIKTLDNERHMQFPYDIIIRDPEKIKELHMEVIYGIFKELFQDEYEKAKKELDTFIQSAIDNPYPSKRIFKEMIINNRIVGFYKSNENPGGSVEIGRYGYRY